MLPNIDRSIDMKYRITGTTEFYQYEREAAEAFLNTSLIVPIGASMWMCIKTGATCIAVRE